MVVFERIYNQMQESLVTIIVGLQLRRQ
jgi:hypothetical protein